MARNVLTLANFYAGLSNDQYLGPDGAYQSGNNLEIRKNPRFARLQSALLDVYASFTPIGPIIKTTNAYEYVSSSTTPTNQVLFWCMGSATLPGRVYDESGNTVYTFPAGEKIVGVNVALFDPFPDDTIGALTYVGDKFFVAFTYDGSVGRAYIIRVGVALSQATWLSANVHQMTFTDLSTTFYVGDLGTGPADFGVPTLNPNNEYILAAFGEYVYCVPNQVNYDSGAGTYHFVKFQPIHLQPAETVSYLGYFADQVHVYTSRKKLNGRYLTYDTATLSRDNASPNFVANMEGRGILTGVTIGNTDYLVCKSNKYTSLWACQGYYVKKVYERVNADGEEVVDFETFHPNAMMEVNGIVMVAGKGGVYSYGHWVDGLPDSMQMDQELPNCDAGASIGRIGRDNEMCAVSYHDSVSNTWKVQAFLLTTPPATFADGSPYYRASGNLASRVFTAGLVGRVKQTVEMDIGYLIPAKGSGIGATSAAVKIYARRSPMDTWTLAGTINSSVPGFVPSVPSRYKITANNLPASLREWHTIEIKAELLAGSTMQSDGVTTKSNDQTPYFYDLTLEYDDGIKD